MLSWIDYSPSPTYQDFSRAGADAAPVMKGNRRFYLNYYNISIGEEIYKIVVSPTSCQS